MYRNFLSLLVALVAVSLLAGAASAALTINYNWDSATVAPTETEEATNYVFTNLRTPLDATVPDLNYNAGNDLAFGILPVLVGGSLHSVSGPISALTDGHGALNGTNDYANMVFCADHGTMNIRISLASIQPIGQINTYVWDTSGDRAPQEYSVYASDGTAPGFVLNNYTSPGWTLIASPNNYTYYGSPAHLAGQNAVSISDTSGSLGNYQHFTFVVTLGQVGGYGSLYNEFAIVGAVPEPGTLALLAAGLAGLLCYAWRKRR